MSPLCGRLGFIFIERRESLAADAEPTSRVYVDPVEGSAADFYWWSLQDSVNDESFTPGAEGRSSPA